MKKLFIALFFILCGCYPNNDVHTMTEKVDTPDLKSVVISAKLGPSERVIFSYPDFYFRQLQISLSNPGDKDTVMTHKIILMTPTVFS